MPLSLSAVKGVIFAGVAAASALVPSAAPAQAFLGLYEGTLLISEGPEPYVLRFDADGGMLAISLLETVERETPGIGVWEPTRGSGVAFGYISYREGSGWICTDFDDLLPPASCTLIVTGRASVEPNTGMMTGAITVTVKDAPVGNGTFGPIQFSAKRRSVADLVLQQLP